MIFVPRTLLELRSNNRIKYVRRSRCGACAAGSLRANEITNSQSLETLATSSLPSTGAEQDKAASSAVNRAPGPSLRAWFQMLAAKTTCYLIRAVKLDLPKLRPPPPKRPFHRQRSRTGLGDTNDHRTSWRSRTEPSSKRSNSTGIRRGTGPGFASTTSTRATNIRSVGQGERKTNHPESNKRACHGCTV